MGAAMKATETTPIDVLDRDILTLCTRINAATYELLVMIREFDERAGWLQWGLSNCAEWLAWRCDLSLTTAREKVRVAHALSALPAIAGSFASGELSYAKVRELTRVADRDNEQFLLKFALRTTAMHVAERCRELRNGSVDSTDVASRAYANRALRIRHDRRREMTTITIELPMDNGALVEKALDAARDDEVKLLPGYPEICWATRQADAFMNLLKSYLSGEIDGSGDHYLVTVHVDQSALAGGRGRAGLPLETVKRLCCDGQAIVITEDSQGEPLGIGRKSRTVPAAIQRAVRARDHHRCTFPGCHNQRFLRCHHVEHWANGGETSLDNLLLLCAKHHTLVHEGGFRIVKDYRDEWTFVKPDGIAVPGCGYLYEAMQNPPAGGMLSVAERTVRAPPPEA